MTHAPLCSLSLHGRGLRIATRTVLTLLGGLMLSSAWAGEASTYRYEDSSKQSVYSDRLPPPGAHTPMLLEKNGRSTPMDKKSTVSIPLTPAEENLARADRALLTAYSSPAEIDRVRDQNLQVLSASLEYKRLQLENLEDLQKADEATVTQAAAKATPAQKKQLEDDYLEIFQLKKQIESLNQRVSAINQKAEADKQRWIELKTNPSVSPASRLAR